MSNVNDVMGLMLNQASKEGEVRKIKKIYIEDIKENEFNTIPCEDIDALAESIKQNGLYEPLDVYKEDDHFVLLSGHRRLKAIKQLMMSNEIAYDEIDCFVSTKPKSTLIEKLDLISRNGYRPKDKIFMSKQIKLVNEVYEELTDEEKPKGKKRDWIGSIVGLSGRSIQEYLNELESSSTNNSDLDGIDEGESTNTKSPRDKKEVDVRKYYKKLIKSITNAPSISVYLESCQIEEAKELHSILTDSKNIIEDLLLESRTSLSRKE